MTEESLYSKDTRLTALNKAHQISDPLRMSQKKSLIIREVQREAALTQDKNPRLGPCLVAINRKVMDSVQSD